MVISQDEISISWEVMEVLKLMDYDRFWYFAVFKVALSELRKNGIEIEEMRQLRITNSLAKSLYKQHEGKFFYDRLVRHISSGDVIAMRVNGNARKCIGSSRLWPRIDPSDQPIRQKFALSDVRNVAHASDEDAAMEELELFRLA